VPKGPPAAQSVPEIILVIAAKPAAQHREISAGLAALIERLAGPLANEIVPRSVMRGLRNDARRIARDRADLREWKGRADAVLTDDHPERTAPKIYSQIGLREQEIGELSLRETGSYNRALKQAEALVLPTIEHDSATNDDERRVLADIVVGTLEFYLERSYVTPDDACSEAVVDLLDSEDGEDVRLQPLRMQVWDAYQDYTDALAELNKVSPGPSLAAQQRATDNREEHWKAYETALRSYVEIRLVLFLRQCWATGP
jgi:hypothetical protein